ncbi:MAG: tRNA (N6-threonylcarbamoyladenosine(37)-N6)-methyltransferase TrmO [Acutalibacteraceae bacterium]|nr:tRNA (N6-threonylcarbamoyladenosine(37)-N6)-methyltransferase TrmO [Acutalibacteraceae bacterium]
MDNTFSLKKIAVIRNGFSEKFGIPRQSGLCESLKARIIFEPEYRVPEAFRGLEDFSHIWLIWQFSEAVRDDWSPTVRPPRLGGNKRLGVFATRSPFRPNPLGLSCARLDRIEMSDEFGPVLHISGADLMDGTPIFDIKPYIPYADCITDAAEGFTGNVKRKFLKTSISEQDKELVGEELATQICELLSEDPRPAYQNDPDRIYKMSFSGYLVSFFVKDDTAVITKIKEEEK